MGRIQDWEIPMLKFFLEAQTKTMQWGSWDCALVSAAHIDNITGTEFYKTHAGKYHSRETAAAYLASIGADGLASLAAMTLGAPLDDVNMAEPGDIGVFDTREGPALGIIDLSGKKIAGINPFGPGFVRFPRSIATAVWRV